MRKRFYALILPLFLGFASTTWGQDRFAGFGQALQPFHASYYNGLSWRNLGPARGGRCNAVAGLPHNPLVYYMGATGGGIWKTEDGGMSWNNVSDGFLQTGSIGALAIAPSNPNVIYAGTGEHAVRSVMTSAGDGVYRSNDGGKTWDHLGLVSSEHIASICVHPSNPDWVYVAVQGALYNDSAERGVYFSKDGGQNWEKILYLNPSTGASDLSMDPSNPSILYAGMWDHQRNPWHIRSGGPGSGLYKSVDGGKNWQKLEQGLPQYMGKVAIAVAPSNPSILYALIESDKGGLFRSENGGLNWQQTSTDRNTFSRAWYFTELEVDPKNAECVYVLNINLLKSIDGGKSFFTVKNPHPDQHDLWINPIHPNTMILANDGGATISFNGGQSWSTQANQPTGQFYRLTTDYQFPMTIYSAQQDFATLAINSRADTWGANPGAWQSLIEYESANVALDPMNPGSIYCTNYQGNIARYDAKSGHSKDLMAYPRISVGNDAQDFKFRFNWNAPLVNNPFNQKQLFHGANVVLQSTDGGINWTPISPDLSHNEKAKQGPGGGPFLNEAAGAEIYNTISYLACSPHIAGEIWAGTDDGLLHVTRDAGRNWFNVTPPGLPESYINCIEISAKDPGSVYVAAMGFRFGDRHPYVFHTTDYGETWKKITQGFGINDFVRVVREDPIQKGLLYAGTESGFYLSFDGGNRWNALQINLPACPITDLQLRADNLVAATAGRGIWILDDIQCLRKNPMASSKKSLSLYAPVVSYRSADMDRLEYSNIHPGKGMIITYVLPEVKENTPLKLKVMDEQGKLIREFTREASYWLPGTLPHPQKGLNRLMWDLRRFDLPNPPANQIIAGDFRGSMVPPGRYQLRLVYGSDSTNTVANVMQDPRIPASTNDLAEQNRLLLGLEQMIREVQDNLSQMIDLRQQLKAWLQATEKQANAADLAQAGQTLISKIDEWEKGLLQPEHQVGADLIAFPSPLMAELVDLKYRVDGPDPRVTGGANLRLIDLKKIWVRKQALYKHIIEQEVADFNRIFRQKDWQAIPMPPTTRFR
jgi:photosystem II stability/assembly factor-like uncharacterized protein